MVRMPSGIGLITAEIIASIGRVTIPPTLPALTTVLAIAPITMDRSPIVPRYYGSAYYTPFYRSSYYSPAIYGGYGYGAFGSRYRYGYGYGCSPFGY